MNLDEWENKYPEKPDAKGHLATKAASQIQDEATGKKTVKKGSKGIGKNGNTVAKKAVPSKAQSATPRDKKTVDLVDQLTDEERDAIRIDGDLITLEGKHEAELVDAKLIHADGFVVTEKGKPTVPPSDVERVLTKKAAKEANAVALSIPQTMTLTSWQLPDEMSEEAWVIAGQQLRKAEGGVQWWYGDWWLAGKKQKWWVYGEGTDFAKSIGVDYKTIRNYASTCKAFEEKTRRRDNLSFSHHAEIAALPQEKQDLWLDRAVNEALSTNKLRFNITRGRAIAKTHETAIEAESMGQYAVLYADPPWRYENPPIGGGPRSIENHYPTMTLSEITALPVASLAEPDSVLYLWATPPKLHECLLVMQAWGFEYRTNMVWVKDQWGMGYWCRQQHELLLIGKRGNITPPDVCKSLSSVIEAPRLDHSSKPEDVLNIIDKSWPGIRKLELFARPGPIRHEWSVWGNQVNQGDAQDEAVNEDSSDKVDTVA
jgi:N6-adenosine-specific RNA methylase IME4